MTKSPVQSETPAKHATATDAETPTRAEANNPRVNEKLARFLRLMDGEMSGRDEA